MSTTTKSVSSQLTSAPPPARLARKKLPSTINQQSTPNNGPDSLDSVSSSSTANVGPGTGHSAVVLQPVTGRWAGRKTLSRMESRLSASQGSLARHWGSVSSLAPSERSTATFLLRPGYNGKAAPLSKLELANAIPLTTSARFYLNYSSVRSVLTSDEQLVHCPLHLAHRCNPFSCYHPQVYNSISAKNDTTDAHQVVCLVIHQSAQLKLTFDQKKISIFYFYFYFCLHMLVSFLGSQCLLNFLNFKSNQSVCFSLFIFLFEIAKWNKSSGSHQLGFRREIN